MLELVPLSALPTPLLESLLEQGGPLVGAVAVLWWRMNKLEQRFSARLDRLDEDVSANSGLIYDRLLPHHAKGERPPSEAPSEAPSERPRSRSD